MPMIFKEREKSVPLFRNTFYNLQRFIRYENPLPHQCSLVIAQLPHKYNQSAIPAPVLFYR